MIHLLLLLSALALAEDLECPEGQVRVATDNPYDPFKCQAPNAPGSLLSTVGGARGFKTRPRCPTGFHPVMTPNKLQPYKCVKKAPGSSAEPDITAADAPLEEAPVQRGLTIGEQQRGPKACPEGTKSVKVQDDPFDPIKCVPIGAAKAPAAYRRYTIPGELALEFPRQWHLTDGWKDEVPTLYVLHDDGNAQKVTLAITRHDAAQEGFEPLEEHLVKEREWQRAADRGRVTVSGVPARLTEIPDQGRTAYLPVSSRRYYTLAYSAPPEQYALYLPVYERLLKSFKLNP